RARATDDAASRVAVAAAVAVDTAPGAVAGTVRLVVGSIADRARAGHRLYVHATAYRAALAGRRLYVHAIADRETAGRCLTIDGHSAVGAALLQRQPAEPAAYARTSAVGAVALPAADFAVSGFSQPVAVAQTDAAVAPDPAVPDFDRRAAVVAQT